MTYAKGLGAQTGDISIGSLAKRDPLMAFSSVMASNLIRQASRRPSGKRLGWIRGELNKVDPGLGDAFASKARELRRKGSNANQALFDGLRLSLANHFASHLSRLEPATPMQGLGGKGQDVFCGILATGTAAGAIGAGFKNPSGSAAIGEAGSQALQAAGCNQGALEAQARIAEANAAAAQANAAASAQRDEGGDKTMVYVAVGGGALLLTLLGVMALK